MFSVPGGTSRAVVHWSDSATDMEVLHDLEPRFRNSLATVGMLTPIRESRKNA